MNTQKTELHRLREEHVMKGMTMKRSSLATKFLASGENRAGRWRWIALVLVSLALFLDALDVSIVNVALPNIQRDLSLPTTDLTWVQGAYLLTYAGFMLLGGRAADLLGRRRIFLLGATLFGMASLASGQIGRAHV